MNHILREILLDWVAKDAQIQMLQEELEKARAQNRECWRKIEDTKAERDELKAEVKAMRKAPEFEAPPTPSWAGTLTPGLRARGGE